ncbi:glyoxalase-like protein [Streptohalobacillus salinus]|uniref:Glyoxalase-like protein n=1 Tax=Streptohalobacillus salinus TaxID=621096 RepID=A0A2V3W635_9BACI|nr:VOC family protein [Streptohalobacillus salinus]PXW88491.1 glyoxalase-like protein [Streptohalobacillus salinus]
MTQLYWDHIVHYVNDLDQVIQQFEKNGLVAFHGGSHTQWGTGNALSYFGLSYIEFLSIEDRQLIEQLDTPNDVVKDAIKYLPEYEVMSRMALRTDDIDQVASELAKTNLSLSPIMDGKRIDAEGHLIEWRMMTISGDFSGLSYPFVIQWKDSDEERQSKREKAGIPLNHPIGEVTIAEGVFEVTDPEASAQHWRKLFGFDVIEQDGTCVKLAIGNQSLIFKKGTANQLKKIVMDIDSDQGANKSIQMGAGEYLFRKR